MQLSPPLISKFQPIATTQNGHLIIPNSIHTKPRLRNSYSGNPVQVLILPPIDLQPALLVVRNRHPLVAPRARADGVTVPAARRRRAEEQLLLDASAVAQLEACNVALQLELVRARRREHVLAAEGECADVGAIEALAGLGVLLGDSRRDQGEAVVGVDGHVRGRVDDVLADAVAGLHQGVQVVARGVHGDPARVVTGIGGVDGADQLNFTGRKLAVRPQLVGRQVGRVEVGLGRVEHHAVDARVLLVFVVLDVLLELAGVGHGEDVAVAGELVEGVGIDGVGGLLGREKEDGAGVGVGVVGTGCTMQKDLLAMDYREGRVWYR